MVPSEDQKSRLANVIAWVRTAKENLPAINDAAVPADRIALASALLDRMYRIAVALRTESVTEPATEPGRQAA